MKEKIEIQTKNYEWLLGSINNADAKAGLLITIVLALIGFTVTQMDQILDCSRVLIIVMPIVVLASSLISLTFAIFAIWPKFTRDSKSLFYFNSIRSINKDEYTKWILKSDDNALLEDITGQVWYLSKIIRNKYKHIRIGMVFFSLSLLLLILTYIIGT